MIKKPRKAFPTDRSVISELRNRLRQERERLLEEAHEKTERAEQITRLLARTEPAKHKRFQPGDELTEIG